MMGQEFNESTLETWASLFDEYKLNWDKFDTDMFEHYKFLIQLRTNNPAFWMGELTFIRNSEELVLSYSRHYEDSKYLIIVNLSKDALFVQLDKDALTGDVIKDTKNVIYRTGRDDHRSEKDSSSLWIDCYETIIYKI
jgi:glycosidase